MSTLGTVGTAVARGFNGYRLYKWLLSLLRISEYYPKFPVGLVVVSTTAENGVLGTIRKSGEFASKARNFCVAVRSSEVGGMTFPRLSKDVSKVVGPEAQSFPVMSYLLLHQTTRVQRMHVCLHGHLCTK